MFGMKVDDDTIIKCLDYSIIFMCSAVTDNSLHTSCMYICINFPPIIFSGVKSSRSGSW